MKGKDFERLARKHLQSLLREGYVVKGKRLVETPTGLVLRGFAVDDSSFDASRFTLWAFAQPLYVPDSTLVLTIGRRLGALDGGQEKWWALTADNEAAVFAEVAADMRAAARTFVARCRTPDGLADLIPEVVSPKNPYGIEALASSCILAGRLEEARIHLDTLRLVMSAPKYDWERDVLRRAERLQSTLAADPDQARRLLQEWATGTAHALGVPADAA